MMSAVVYVAADKSAALSMCELLGSAKVEAITLAEAAFGFSSGVPLVVIWSQAAARAEADVLGCVRGHDGPVTVCLIDEMPAPRALMTLADGMLNGRAFARAAHVALPGEQDSADVVGGSEAAFAGGFARGFVGSVSILGLCGALAIGVSDRVTLPGTSEEVDVRASLLEAASAAAASFHAEASDIGLMTVEAPNPGALISDEELRSYGVALRLAEARDRSVVDAKLGDVDQIMGEAETELPIQEIAALPALDAYLLQQSRQANAAPAPAPPVTARAPEAAVQQINAEAERNEADMLRTNLSADAAAGATWLKT